MTSIPTLAALAMAVAFPASIASAANAHNRPLPAVVAQFGLTKGSGKEAELAKGKLTLSMEIRATKGSAILIRGMEGATDGKGGFTFRMPTDDKKAAEILHPAALDNLLHFVSQRLGDSGSEKLPYVLSVAIFAGGKDGKRGPYVYQRGIEMSHADVIKFYLGAYHTGIHIAALGEGDVNKSVSLTVSSMGEADKDDLIPAGYKFEAVEGR